MKKLGLIGGTSWISTVDYYKLINQGVNDKLGGHNFSECILYSFNFADIVKNNESNNWDSTFKMVLQASNHLKSCGAEAIVLCANTMHLIADRLEKELDIPIIHIATATAVEIEKTGIKKVALLGTKFTMELDFFKLKLTEKGIETMIPNEEDRVFIHKTIFEELSRGEITKGTKKRYLKIIENLIKNGAEGIILGCTEIPLIIKPTDVSVPTFDTVEIHSNASIEFQLS